MYVHSKLHWQDCMWSEIIMLRVSHVSYPYSKLQFTTVTLEHISQLKYFRVDNSILVVESAVRRFEIWLVNNLSLILSLYDMATYDDSKRYQQASSGVSTPLACPKPSVGDCFWFIYARSEELKKTQSPTQKLGTDYCQLSCPASPQHHKLKIGTVNDELPSAECSLN